MRRDRTTRASNAVTRGGQHQQDQTDQPVQQGHAAATGQAAGRLWREHAEHLTFPEPLLDLIAARFRLLAEPIRLKLLALIALNERSVGELARILGTSQPNVSKHLSALTQGGLVKRRKVGTTTLFSIADPSAFTLCDAVCVGLQERFAAEARALGLPSHAAEHGG